MRLTIRRVGVAELTDRDPFVVVLAEEEEDGVGAVVELRRGLSFDEQDEALAQDTYCELVLGGPEPFHCGSTY
jgi:hypothetical protein